MSASVDVGSLSGNTSFTIPDRQTNENYGLTWTNNVTEGSTVSGTLSISVSSGNGNATTTVTRTLVKPVSVLISPSAPVAGALVTVIPSGGSETTGVNGGYTIVHVGAASPETCDFGGSITYNAGLAGVTDVVIVTDNITGESAEASYTVPE